MIATAGVIVAVVLWLAGIIRRPSSTPRLGFQLYSIAGAKASTYSKSEDWIFASPHTKGKYPFWPDVLLLKIIQPAARRAGIKKRVGWHTFRHSYSSLLVANGENVKVVQELMRHASSRFTLDVYSQARKGAKRQAQERVVQMILTESSDDAIPAISLEGTQNDAA